MKRLGLVLATWSIANSYAFAQTPCRIEKRDFSKATGELAAVIIAPFSQKNCEVLASNGEAQQVADLSPYWAQDEVGADLAKQFLAAKEKAKTQLNDVSISDVDIGFKGDQQAHLTRPPPDEPDAALAVPTHATQVMNVIGGAGLYGVGYKNTIEPISYGRGLAPALTEAATSSSRIVNLEIHTLPILTDSAVQNLPFQLTPNELNKALPPIADQKLLVAAAGNFYQAEGEIHESFHALQKVILVGSTNEQGLISDFSNTSRDVTIFAPSDYHMASPGTSTNHKFGGTSGATPLVSGALSNVLNLVSDLRANEAKTLLSKTSTPLPSSDFGSGHGTGLLNAYKLVRVADRLRTRGWPISREQLLADPQLYDFAEESSQDMKSAVNLLKKQPRSCADFKDSVSLLRKSFLLQPATLNANLLAMALLASRTPADSEFYSIRTKQSVERLVLNEHLKSDGKIPWAQLRLMRQGVGGAAKRVEDEMTPSLVKNPPAPSGPNSLTLILATSKRVSQPLGNDVSSLTQSILQQSSSCPVGFTYVNGTCAQ